MDLITKQILANHQIRITESLRQAGLGESYYWLRLGDKAEMFSSVEEMVNRLNETVPAPWTIHRKGSKYTILVSDKFKDGTPFQAFKTEDTNTEVTQALDDAELRLLVSYRGEAKDEEPNPYCPGCGRVVSGEYVPDHVDDAHRSTNPGRLCPGSGKKAVMARWTKDEMGCAAVGGGAAGGFAVGTAKLPKDKKDDEESDAVQPVPPVEPVYGNKPMLPKYLKKGKKEPKGDFRTQLMQGLKQQRESEAGVTPEVEDRINYGHGGYATLVKEVEGYDVEKEAWIVTAHDGRKHLIQPDKMDGDHMTWWTLSSEPVAKSKGPSDKQQWAADEEPEEVIQSFNYEKKEAFGVTGTSNQGGMVQPLPQTGKGEPCWVCGTPIISTTSCHLCGADRE